VGSAGGDEDASAEFLIRLHQRLLEYVTSGPEGLTAVDQELCLGTMGHKVNGAGEDKPVGCQQLGIHPSYVVLDGTFALFLAMVALIAGHKVTFCQADFLYLVF